MAIKLTLNEFIDKCNIIHNDIFDYSLVEYKGQQHKIDIICKVHGVFNTLAGNHLRGSGCPLCANFIRNNKVRLDTNKFNARLIERNKKYSPVVLIGEYINMKTKIEVMCENNHKWFVNPQDILVGHGCMICLRDKDRLYHTQQHISTEILSLLNNKEWLYEQHIINRLTMEKISSNIGVTPKCVSSYMKKHDIVPHRFGNSQIERDLLIFLQSIISVDIICNDRTTINPLELDFYIPDFKLGIEINGIYWHSELNGRSKEYHSNKTTLCNDRGIQLIQIWDSEWLYKQDIVKSRIKNLLGLSEVLYARNCNIDIVSTIETRKFMNNNHIQGYVNSSIKLGLYFDNELVGMMTFGKSRFNKNIQYELLRFVTKRGFSIIGGASKLHKFFVNNYNPSSIISYCDLRYGTGKLYEILQYEQSGISLPNQHYFKRNNSQKIYSRHLFQKHKMKDKLETFDPLLTGWENMVNNGYDRIWDCGNSVWIWNR